MKTKFNIGDVICTSIFYTPMTMLLIIDIFPDISPGQIYKCIGERSWNYYHLGEDYDPNIFIVNNQDIIDRLKKKYQAKILIDIIEK